MANAPKKGGGIAGTSKTPVAAALPSNSGASAAADDYDAQADLHTLMRAHEIKTDPKRHARAKAHAKKKLGQMKAVVGADASYVGPKNGAAQGNMGD